MRQTVLYTRWLSHWLNACLPLPVSYVQAANIVHLCFHLYNFFFFFYFLNKNSLLLKEIESFLWNLDAGSIKYFIDNSHKCTEIDISNYLLTLKYKIKMSWVSVWVSVCVSVNVSVYFNKVAINHFRPIINLHIFNDRKNMWIFYVVHEKILTKRKRRSP